MRMVAATAVIAIVCAAAAFTQPAFAQEYPTKPVRVIVPWPAGGLVDVAGRVVGNQLQASLGQPFLMDNKPGAGGVIGADLVAKADPDGYTIALTTSALNMGAALARTLPFDVTKDFEPIAAMAFAPSVLIVHPSLEVKSVRDLIAMAKAKPGKLTYASAGQGTPAHFSAELLKSMTGLDVLHVPYKGAPPAMTDQIAGRVDFHFANTAVALPQIAAGKVRALAVTSAQRFAGLPDVPTMAEAGVPDFEADQWVGFLAPRGTPAAVVQRLLGGINKALAMEDVRATLANRGIRAATPATPAQFGAYLAKDLAKWVGVVKAANIQPN